MALQMLGITCVPLPLKPEDGFQPTVEACEALITPRTRAITLVTPNNPVRRRLAIHIHAPYIDIALEFFRSFPDRCHLPPIPAEVLRITRAKA